MLSHTSTLTLSHTLSLSLSLTHTHTHTHIHTYPQACVTGTSPDTGVCGLTMAGGWGYLSRKHGFACDNLLAARVCVCGSGEVVVATDSNEHKDLLYAIRGVGSVFVCVCVCVVRVGGECVRVCSLYAMYICMLCLYVHAYAYVCIRMTGRRELRRRAGASAEVPQSACAILGHGVVHGCLARFFPGAARSLPLSHAGV
jgi:hypothetical protein